MHGFKHRGGRRRSGGGDEAELDLEGVALRAVVFEALFELGLLLRRDAWWLAINCILVFFCIFLN